MGVPVLVECLVKRPSQCLKFVAVPVLPLRPIESERRVLAFYANSIAHLVEASTGEPVAESAAR